MSKKTLLVLAASLYQLETIRTAKRLGYNVVTTDNLPSNPGHALADKCYSTDTTDLDGVLRIARRERIDGVMSPCTDVSVPTAAYVAERLGLPGPPFSSTQILCSKPAFREFLTSSSFPCPKAHTIRGGCALPSGMWGSRRWIIKPDRSSGSKGVFIVSSEDELRSRMPESLSFSPTGTALVEEYIEGHQGTCEGVLRNGEIVMVLVTDRQTADPPFAATHGHSVPSSLPASMSERLVRRLVHMWALLGVTDGPFDCDFVATDSEVYVLEMTPRMGGNSIGKLLRFSLEFDLVEYSVKVACGDAADLPARNDPHPASIALLGCASRGRLRYNESEARRLEKEPWVVSLSLDLPVGVAVGPFINGRHRVGEALVRGSDAHDVASKVAELKARLHVEAR